MSHDPHLVAKIMQKRAEEMARRTKLLDPRKRMYGVDHAVLDEQVAQKQAALEYEAAEDSFYAKSQYMVDEVLQTIEGAKQDATRERQIATMEFNRQNGRKEDRREWELSDPTALKREEPIPDYSKMGPSSMLVFEGHHIPDKGDLAAQTAAWLGKQVQEKKDREAAERERDLYYDSQQIAGSHIRKYIDQTEEEEKRQDKVDEAMANLDIAEQHRARRQAKVEKEKAAKDAHAAYVANHDMLTEKHDWKLGTNGKLTRMDYKRLSQEEQQDVLNTNARLLLEKKAKEQFMKDDGAYELQGINNCIGVLAAVESEQERLRRERQMAVVRENAAMAEAKRARDAEARMAYKSFDGPR